MIKNIIIFIAGGIFFTVGFSGVAKILDNGVEKTKAIAIEQSK
jgi:hypothetical protein